MKVREIRRSALAVVLIAMVCATLVVPPAVFAEDEKSFEVYGFVQGDYIQDFNRVDPDWKATLRPSKIPTDEGAFGGDGQAILSARQSRFGATMTLPTEKGSIYTKFEFDMYGTGDDAGQTTIRLRHAYGQWGKWLAGQTNTLFMDGSIFPNVIDYWGPTGMVFIRNPQIRFTPFSGKRTLSIAIENPSNDIDTGEIRQLDPALVDNIQANQPVPDLTAQFRMEQGWGHLQFAGVLREVGFDTAGTPDNEPEDSELGWGLDVTSGINMGQNSKLLVGVVYGEGIANYMNDGGTDLAPEGELTSPRAEALPLTGVSAYLDHRWSDKFSSSFGYSLTQVDNTALQDPFAYHRGQYASMNLIYYPVKGTFIGFEALWGDREDNDGDSGDDLRLQTSFHYSFSSKDILKKD